MDARDASWLRNGLLVRVVELPLVQRCRRCGLAMKIWFSQAFVCAGVQSSTADSLQYVAIALAGSNGVKHVANQIHRDAYSLAVGVAAGCG